MSTRFQRPAAAYTGAGGLSNRTKYQNDATAIPTVAIDDQKIDGDFNYVIDALNVLDDGVTSLVVGAIPDASLTLAKLTDGTAASVAGRSAGTDGVRADIVAAADNTILARTSGTLAFSKVTSTMVDSGVASSGNVLQADGAGAAAWATINSYPTGGLAPFAGSSAPTGWLFCYGQNVSRATYSALFSALSTTYGAGDGSTTFALPDLRGRSIFGRDDMGGSAVNRITNAVAGITATNLGATGGNQLLSNHTHTATVNDSGHAHANQSYPSGGASTTYTGGSGSGVPVADRLSTATATTGITVTVNATGGGGSANIPPAIIMNWIIKT